MMRRVVALLLCGGIALPGCATAGSPRLQRIAPTTTSVQSAKTLGEYAEQLGVGTRVRAVMAGNRTVRGTLVKTTNQAIFIQPRTRLAEPVVEIPLDQLLSLDKEVPSGGVGKSIAIGAASGAGAAIGVILILIAVLGD